MVGLGSNLQRNRILNALSTTDLALLQRHLEPVPLRFRQRLHSSNRQIKDVYFPESGIASVVAVSRSDSWQAEVGMIGHEGMTGLPVVYGTARSPYDVFVQVEGRGQCISARNLLDAMRQSLTMLGCFLRYAHVFSVQSGFAALANACGHIDERLARWLLMTRDRVDSDRMQLTHEFMAAMLGVRRAGVTAALQGFQRSGLIETARGNVIVLDRERLLLAANGLYGVPEAEFERLFAA
jgi:CRP-like cAMP-binding protein